MWLYSCTITNFWSILLRSGWSLLCPSISAFVNVIACRKLQRQTDEWQRMLQQRDDELTTSQSSIQVCVYLYLTLPGVISLQLELGMDQVITVRISRINNTLSTVCLSCVCLFVCYNVCYSYNITGKRFQLSSLNLFVSFLLHVKFTASYCIVFWHPLTHTWPHLRCEVGLEEGEY